MIYTQMLASFSTFPSKRNFFLGCLSCIVFLIIFDVVFSDRKIITNITSILKLDSDINNRVAAVVEELQRVKKRVEKSSTSGSLAEYIAKAKETRPKVVLLYTSFFQKKPWGWMNNNYDLNHWEGVQCPYFRCELTNDHRELSKADAAIFHSMDMPGTLILRRLLHLKPKPQKWVYFAREAPTNNKAPDQLNNLFHWTLSYRPSSTFYFPYGYYYKANKLINKPPISYTRGKTKLAVWIASHCGLLRDKVVQNLLKYIKIDVIGKCADDLNVKRVKCIQDSPKCKRSLRRYKFLLAFENSFCSDYITEKYWMALNEGIVPVVLGGASYTSDMAIPGSFINAMDFPSAKALAKRLLYLDKNVQEYSKYLEWQNRYAIITYSPWNCELCAALHMNTTHLPIAGLETFWSAQHQCGNKERKAEKLIQ